MSAPACYAACTDVLRNGTQGVDVTISTEPPLVAGPWTTEPFVCPHGIAWWLEPTGEQAAKWAAEGTP